MTLNFENLTIGQLRKLTEDYKQLDKENKILKVKYPNKISKIPSDDISAEELIEGLKRETLKK